MGRVYIQSGKYDGYLHVDNIEITGDKPAVDVRVNTFSGSQAPVMGTETTYTVAVENNGLNEAKDVKVEFFADNELVSERNITLPVDKTEELEFPFTPAIAEEGNIHLTVKLTLEGDLNLGNNELSLNVRTVTPLLSFVNDLKATVEDGNNVVLSWSDPSEYPAGAAKHEDFSTFEDYALNNFGGWTTYDADKITTTNGITGGGFTYTWPHSGEPQAFIVFNPKRVGVSGLFEPSSVTVALYRSTHSASQRRLAHRRPSFPATSRLSTSRLSSSLLFRLTNTSKPTTLIRVTRLKTSCRLAVCR